MTSTAPGTTGPKALLPAFRPIILDVAVPLALYYALTSSGVSDTWALVAGAVLPGGRALLGFRHGRPDNLSILMAAEFVLSLCLLAVTGSPKVLLLRNSFGTVLFGLWCLAGVRSARPVTFYTARPFVTRGEPAKVDAWERLADSSSRFRSIQHRLAVVWGLGLLVEAGLRVLIVERFPLHTAVWLTDLPAIGIIAGLSIASGPLGGAALDRMVKAEVAASTPATVPVPATA